MYRGLRAAHTAGESNNVTDQGRNLSFTTATKKITHRSIYIYVYRNGKIYMKKALKHY